MVAKSDRLGGIEGDATSFPCGGACVDGGSEGGDRVTSLGRPAVRQDGSSQQWISDYWLRQGTSENQNRENNAARHSLLLGKLSSDHEQIENNFRTGNGTSHKGVVRIVCCS